jgi:metallophosphoesterase superfamily enzyme
MKQYLNIVLIIGGLALLGGTFAYGYHKGSVSEIQKIADRTAEKQQELLDLGDVVRMQTEALRQLKREKEDLINALEEEATVAPGSNNPGIATTGGMQRLERRWGPSPGTSD